ncbi:CHAP domain-containing protein [Nocardia jejuensis]|uniref:CHAP domain-containing protein n=1 Tax=Nocardia jejuensis TaxID=328049 RepID=UPI00082FDD38|nr:CHAP domain-containing protein [Nocardia jejuensis]
MTTLENPSDTSTPRRRRRGGRWLSIIAVLATLAILGGTGVYWWKEHSPLAAVAGDRMRTFPAVDRTGLDETQNRILDVLQREFSAQNPGTKYSEGIAEQWCADFVSWVMREAGRPLANPNSGSWRIPGVYTLEEYYRGQDRFVAPNAEYRPRVGDVMLYAEGSVFNQHTNIVIASADGLVTTVGGNEFGKVSIHKYRPADYSGVVGIGRL